MGGAFVAVASDSSATWWNPAGLATGPFLDLALAGAVTDWTDHFGASRQRGTWFSAATPPAGFSYYRFSITDIRPIDTIDEGLTNRENRRAGMSARYATRALAASHLGITLVQTVFPGLHAGATLKYLRGTVRIAPEEGLGPAEALLDAGEVLEGGDATSAFDVDLGLLASFGGVRVGALMRHVREPHFGRDQTAFVLPRQTRVGVAFDGEAAGGRPLTVAMDADLTRLRTPSGGERRNVALGVEHWFRNKRIGLRGGGRVNTVAVDEKAATLGLSVVPRPGLFLEVHGVRGGSIGEEGWGAAARVSF